jgi:hypothetical protein
LKPFATVNIHKNTQMFQHITRILGNRPAALRALAGIGAVAGIAAIAGCDLGNVNPTGPIGPQGLVQFINAAPRYGSASLKVDTLTAVQGVAYASGQAAFLAAPSKSQLFSVRNAGDTTTIASTQLQIADRTVYAMILTQHATGGGLLVFQDTVSAPPSDQVGLRVINASPSAGPVDVYVTNSDTTLVTANATDVVFEAGSAYITFPAGVVHVRITSAATKDVLLDADVSALLGGQVRTILLMDKIGGGLPATWLSIPDRG